MYVCLCGDRRSSWVSGVCSRLAVDEMRSRSWFNTPAISHLWPTLLPTHSPSMHTILLYVLRGELWLDVARFDYEVWTLDMLSPVHVISGVNQRLLTVLGLWVLLYADRIHTHRCCLLWLDCTHPEILYLFYISAEGGRLSWCIDSAVRVFISPVHQESEADDKSWV